MEIVCGVIAVVVVVSEVGEVVAAAVAGAGASVVVSEASSFDVASGVASAAVAGLVVPGQKTGSVWSGLGSWNACCCPLELDGKSHYGDLEGQQHDLGGEQN